MFTMEDEENWSSFLNNGGPSFPEDGWGWGKLVTLKPKDKKLSQQVIEANDAGERTQHTYAISRAGWLLMDSSARCQTFDQVPKSAKGL